MANWTNPSTTINESDAAAAIANFNEVVATFPLLLVAATTFFCTTFFLLASDCKKRKNTGWELGRERETDSEKGERKNQIKKWEEREKSNKIVFFSLPFVSVPLQIYNGTNTNGKNLAHIEHLMGGDFCLWCGKCVKYFAFATFATSIVGALRCVLMEHVTKAWWKVLIKQFWNLEDSIEQRQC